MAERAGYSGGMTRYAALLALCALSACSGPVETHVASAGAGVAPGMAWDWAPQPEDAAPPGAVEQAVRATIEQRLAGAGHPRREGAPAMLAMGLAERPASIAIRTDDGAGAISGAKGARLLQNCKDRMLRLTLHIAERRSGRTLYSGAAQESHCHAASGEVADALARAALADLRSPGGEARLLSFRKD